MLIRVKHNIEVAHRLYESKGKCEQIHGHSMWVTLSLEGRLGNNGMAVHDINYLDEDQQPAYREQLLEFGAIKKAFRTYLDETFDHRLLLNAADPFSGPIYQVREGQPVDLPDGARTINLDAGQQFLPGLQSMEGDPTTENIAKWIHDWALVEAKLPVSHVEVWETSVNCAVYP